MQNLELPHSKLFYFIAQLQKRDLINEFEKLSLKGSVSFRSVRNGDHRAARNVPISGEVREGWERREVYRQFGGFGSIEGHCPNVPAEPEKCK